MSAWIGLALVSMALAAIGQFSWKLGARAMGSFSLAGVVLSPYVWVGLILFGVSSLIWMKVLTRAPLSVAYPITALSYLVILGLSRFVLGEPVTVLKAVGILTIFVGVALVGIGSELSAHPAAVGAGRPQCVRSHPAQTCPGVSRSGDRSSEPQ